MLEVLLIAGLSRQHVHPKADTASCDGLPNPEKADATPVALEPREPLLAECQHFLDCIEKGNKPLTSGHEGLELVTILEAASASLKENGAPVTFPRSRPAPELETSLPTRSLQPTLV